MTLLISREKMIRDEAHRRAQVTLSQFRNSIRPIYRSAEKGLPVHVGTCTFFRVAESPLVVTAAHIIDQHKKTDLWIGGDKTLTPLTGMFSGTPAPHADRNQDRYDFSVSPVSDELAAGIGSISYIQPGFLSKGRRQDRKHAMYTCMGYPNSQNKEMSAAKREINARMWMHTAEGRSTHDKVGLWAKTTGEHLFIDFYKYAANVDGSKRTSTHPRGTSGGPVFYLGDFNDPDTYRFEARFQPMFEGIIIEKSAEGNVLIAVKIAAIIHALRRAGLIA